MFQNTDKVNWNIWFLIALLLLLVPWFYIAFFAHPIADDYCYANLSRQNDFLQEYCHQYFSWNGRYSSNFFVLLNPVLQSVLCYQLAAAFLLLLTVFGYFIFVKTVLNSSTYSMFGWHISLCLLALFLFQMPSPSEGFYWYTGAVTYQAANALSLFYFALLIQYARKRFFMNKWLHLFLAGLLLAFIIGFNETVLLIVGGLHCCLAFGVFRKSDLRKELGFAIAFLLVVFIISAGFVVTAPGNALRASNYPGNHDVVHSLAMGAFQTIRFTLDWVSNLPFLVLSVLSFPIVSELRNKDALLARLTSCPVSMSTGLLVLIVFAGVFPAYWHTRILGQYRTVNAAYFFFLLAWFFNLACWAAYLEKKEIRNPFMIGKKARIIGLLLVLLAMAGTKNGYYLTTDLLYKKVNAFDLEMRTRNSLMLAAAQKNISVIELSPLKSKPYTLFVHDLNTDSFNWINTSYASFFGRKTAVLKK